MADPLWFSFFLSWVAWGLEVYCNGRKHKP